MRHSMQFVTRPFNIYLKIIYSTPLNMGMCMILRSRNKKTITLPNYGSGTLGS